jgi:solute carrier family 25 protein 33/36
MQQTYKFGTRTIYGLQSTYLKEGVAGLFRGLIPNLVGVVPSRAIHLGSYNKAKRMI